MCFTLHDRPENLRYAAISTSGYFLTTIIYKGSIFNASILRKEYKCGMGLGSRYIGFFFRISKFSNALDQTALMSRHAFLARIRKVSGGLGKLCGLNPCSPLPDRCSSSMFTKQDLECVQK